MTSAPTGGGRVGYAALTHSAFRYKGLTRNASRSTRFR
jgi:hypothetical protein